MKQKFKVPYGLNDWGDLVSAEEAIKSVTYRCPGCDTQLILRSGEVRSKHFAHPSNSECNRESVIHLIAKRLIHEAIKNNALGLTRISLQLNCRRCACDVLIDLPPDTFSGAKQEVKVGNYICDIVGYKKDKICLALEVFNTHKVDSIKAVRLPTFWIELAAEDIIRNAYQWTPTQSRLKDSFCGECKEHMIKVNEVANKFGIERTYYSLVKDSNEAPYIADVDICYKCNAEIPVFWWEGVPFCKTKPPEPMPKTIKRCFSKTHGETYWANTCANCKALQGDHFLHHSGDSPFLGVY